MNRKNLNLLLGALAIGLVAVSVFQQRKDEAKLVEPPKKGEPLTRLDSAKIEHVVLHHPNAPDIVLERKDRRWRLTAPVQAPADSVEVGKLLAIATSESTSKLDTAGIKRADFGLEPPQFTLSLDDTVFSFGDVERIRYLRYVEVNAGKPGDTLALITDPDNGVVDADYTDLVSKKLLPAEVELAGIELPNLKVLRGKDGLWSAQPAAPDATQDDFNRFIDAWKHAGSVRNEAPTAVPGESKNLMAVLSFADGSKHSYLIVNREPELILEDAALKLRYRFPVDVSRSLLSLPKPVAAPAEPKADAAPAPAAPDAAPK